MEMRCELWRDEIKTEKWLLKALLCIQQRGAKWALPKQPYDNVTLTLQNNTLTLRCADARTIVEVELPCVNGLPSRESKEARSVTVPVSLLKFWQTLKPASQGLEFETLKDYPNGLHRDNLRVTTGEGFFHLPIGEVATAHVLPEFDLAQRLWIPVEQFSNALRLTRTAVATATQPHNIDCLLLDKPAGAAQLWFVGTDEHQMVCVQSPVLSNRPAPARCFIPEVLLKPGAESLLGYVLAADKGVELIMSGNWLRLRAGLLTVWHYNSELECTKEGPVYPNYARVQEHCLDGKPICTVEVDSNLLRQTLERIQCFITKGVEAIPLFLCPNSSAEGLAIKTSSKDVLTSGRQFPARITGASEPVSVNPQLLLNFCHHWPGETLQLLFYGSHKPIEIRPTRSDSTGLFCCVMPMNCDLDW